VPKRVRLIDEIAPDLRLIFRDLVLGHSPWPLLLWGLPGRGKSCAALCLLDHVGGLYCKLDTFVKRIRSADLGKLTTGGAPGICEPWIMAVKQAWEPWRECRFAVMDELGRDEDPSRFHKLVLTDAIDSRVEEHAQVMPTLFVSNLGLDGLSRLYGDRIASRLSCGTVRELTGPDRRPTNVEKHDD